MLVSTWYSTLPRKSHEKIAQLKEIIYHVLKALGQTVIDYESWYYELARAGTFFGNDVKT